MHQVKAEIHRSETLSAQNPTHATLAQIMTRPIGITLSAVALGIAATLALLLSVLLTLLAAFTRNVKLPPVSSAQAPAASAGLLFGITLGFSLFLAMLAAWAILTLIGLLRLRSWTRYSTLVIGGFLVFIAACSIFGLALAAFVFPAQPNVPVSTMHTILFVQGLFYSAVAAVGAWWLVFFNLKSTKAYFLPAYAAEFAGEDPSQPTLIHPPGRFAHVPTAIVVLACLLLFSAVCCAVVAFFTLPTFLFGFTLTGPGVHFLYLVYAALMAFIGWGLLRLDNRARLALYAFIGFSALNFTVIISPWGKARYVAYQQLLYSRMALTSTPQIDPASTPFIIAMILFCVLCYGLQIWILQRHRRAFIAAPTPRPV